MRASVATVLVVASFIHVVRSIGISTLKDSGFVAVDAHAEDTATLLETSTASLQKPLDGSADAFRLADADLNEAFNPGALLSSAPALAAGVSQILPALGNALPGGPNLLGSLKNMFGKSFSGPSDTTVSFTRDRKCVLCEYILQRVQEALVNDPSLNYVGPPSDYPFEDTGSIYGSGDISKTKRGKRKMPVPPKPRQELADTMSGGDMGVKPPSYRLSPAEVAQGKGSHADAAAASLEQKAALAAQALASAQKSMALPGANGQTASFEGSIRSLADYSGGAGAIAAISQENAGVVPPRPAALAPVDPNPRLIPALAGEEAASSFVELDEQLSVPDYLLGDFYRPELLPRHTRNEAYIAHANAETDPMASERSAAVFFEAESSLQDDESPLEIPQGLTGFKHSLDKILSQQEQYTQESFLNFAHKPIDATSIVDGMVQQLDGPAARHAGMRFHEKMESQQQPEHEQAQLPAEAKAAIHATNMAIDRLSQRLAGLKETKQNFDSALHAAFEDPATISNSHRFVAGHEHASHADAGDMLAGTRQKSVENHRFRQSLLFKAQTSDEAPSSKDLFVDEIDRLTLFPAEQLPHQSQHTRIARRRAPLVGSKPDATNKKFAHAPSYANPSAEMKFQRIEDVSGPVSLDEQFAAYAEAAVQQDLIHDNTVLLEMFDVGNAAVQAAALESEASESIAEAEASVAAMEALAGSQSETTHASAALRFEHVLPSKAALSEARDDLESAMHRQYAADVANQVQLIKDRAALASNRFVHSDLDPAAAGKVAGDFAGAAAEKAVDIGGALAAKGAAKAGDAAASALKAGVPIAAAAASKGMQASAAAAEGLEKGVDLAVENAKVLKQKVGAAYNEVKEVYAKVAPVVKDAAEKAIAMAAPAARKGAILASKGIDKGFDALDNLDVMSMVKKQEDFNSWGNKPRPVGLYPERGKFGDRERARRSYRIAQQMRFQQLYHAVMSAMESACKTELPECRPVYAYAERITDWFMHGYYVDEICEKVRLCVPGFFDVRPPD